jgi:NADP-dependent 3-hydroxy acid dehydrogenase YdfG
MAEALDGTVALVTGASSGIGEEASRALAARGAAVALVARRRDRLEKLAAQVEERGGSALVIPADVEVPEQAEAAVQRTVDEMGRLDILVNDAGVMLLGPALDAPLEEWSRMVSVNVLGLLHTTHAALPHLVRAAEDSPRRVADLVNVGSVAGRQARAGSAVYNLTKFGVRAFSEGLRQEVTARHVRVSVVEPGRVDTELQDHMRAEVREASMRRFEGVEPLKAHDIAEAIEYIVTRPRHVAVNELLVRPTEQEG